MRKTLLAVAALGAAITLSACGGGYGYYGAEVGPPDVYYDGFYGPYVDGYWGDDGFYYRDGGGHYIHDSGNHFRHAMFGGAHGFHSHARPAGNEHH